MTSVTMTKSQPTPHAVADRLQHVRRRLVAHRLHESAGETEHKGKDGQAQGKVEKPLQRGRHAYGSDWIVGFSSAACWQSVAECVLEFCNLARLRAEPLVARSLTTYVANPPSHLCDESSPLILSSDC